LKQLLFKFSTDILGLYYSVINKMTRKNLNLAPTAPPSKN